MNTHDNHNNPNNYDYVIVGGVLEGLAIAWGLTSRGETSVLVLERTSRAPMTGKSSGGPRPLRLSVAKMAGTARSSCTMPQRSSTTTALSATRVHGRRRRERRRPGRQHRHAAESRDVEFISGTPPDLWPGLHVDDFASIAYEALGGRGDAPMLGMAFAGCPQAGREDPHSTTVTGFTTADGAVTGVELLTARRSALDRSSSPRRLGPRTRRHGRPDLPVCPAAQLMLVNPGADLARRRYCPTWSACSTFWEPNGDILCGTDHAEPHWADPTPLPTSRRQLYRVDHRQGCTACRICRTPH